MNVDNLKVGDKIKCNENGCKYEAVIEKIDYLISMLILQGMIIILLVPFPPRLEYISQL